MDKSELIKRLNKEGAQAREYVDTAKNSADRLYWSGYRDAMYDLATIFAKL